MFRPRILIGLTALLLMAISAGIWRLGGWSEVRRRLLGRASVQERLAQYGPDARARLVPAFEQSGVPYPPKRFVLAAFKSERELHLIAAGPEQQLEFIKAYPVLAASGNLGPKLIDGDLQVPEGLYNIESLNPNSRFHLALRVSYPNEFDLARAGADGRTALGGDIMIHGEASSIGCIAVGNIGVEELFVLAGDVGWENGLVLISPIDFRRHALPSGSTETPSWVPELYADLKRQVEALPLPRQ